MKSFLVVYQLGIWAGISILLLALFKVVIPTYYFLLIGIFYVLILSFFAVRTPLRDRRIAGNRVATAGYLYTLIGFSLILLLLDPADVTKVVDAAGVGEVEKGRSIREILFPMGGALMTSILGWFLGGEIAEHGDQSDEVSVRTATEQVLTDLKGFSGAVQEIHRQYVTSVTGLIATHKELNDKHVAAIDRQEATLRRASEIANQLNTELDPIRQTVVKFRDTMDEVLKELGTSLGETFQMTLREIASEAEKAKNGVRDAGQAADNTKKYLQQTRVLITELEELLNAIAAEKRRH